MKARLLLDRRIQLSPDAFVEQVIWSVPNPVRGSEHDYKYRLALVVNEVCVLRYDNEAGKGVHIHLGDKEFPYSFVDSDKLVVSDFMNRVIEVLNDNRHV
jgi:hypothetical protein